MIPNYGEQIDRRDFSDKNVRLLSPVLKLRHRLFNRWLAAKGRDFWKKNRFITHEDLYCRILQATAEGKPLAVARLGGVEASILMWAEGVANFRWPIWRLFSDTSSGAINAGIRPRNRESYRFFAEICQEALIGVDLLGVWKTGYEALCLGQVSTKVFFDGEITGPDARNPNHWLYALKGKRVLVVCPFPLSIDRQIPHLRKVWPHMRWMEGTEFVVEPFPYLIDENCPETWWEVYERIGKFISVGNYDVALFGCGGLGLPFAYLAKKAERVGIHLGGHLQLIFGIYGQRHLQQPWFRDQMNEYWIRPDKCEVPHSAKRVEGGCYW
jgi:hypothetical protein